MEGLHNVLYRRKGTVRGALFRSFAHLRTHWQRCSRASAAGSAGAAAAAARRAAPSIHRIPLCLSTQQANQRKKSVLDFCGFAFEEGQEVRAASHSFALHA